MTPAPKLLQLLLLSSVFVLIGCVSVGTRTLPKNSRGFNGALINSTEQQLLLNLVRLQFEDRPFFLSVDSITTSDQVSFAGGPNISYGSGNNGSTNANLNHDGNIISQSITRSFSISRLFGFNPSATYSDTPTISFSPLQGAKFTRQMLSPLSVNTIYLLLQSDWNPVRVMRCVLEQIGEYDNKAVLSRHAIPINYRFNDLVQLIEELKQQKVIYFSPGIVTSTFETNAYSPHAPQTSSRSLPLNRINTNPSAVSSTTKTIVVRKSSKSGEIIPIAITINLPPNPIASEQYKISKAKSNKGKTQVVQIPSLDIVPNKNRQNSPQLKKLYRMLGLVNSRRAIHLVSNRNVADVKQNIVAIQTRSFLSILDYLSNAVEVVPDMLKQGLVVAPKYPDGTYYNLNQLTKGMFLVHISSKIPIKNTSVRVFYRNYWFYIADNDYRSKRTFAMLQQIFNLQAGETPGQTVPVLTIPTR